MSNRQPEHPTQTDPETGLPAVYTDATFSPLLEPVKPISKAEKKADKEFRNETGAEGGKEYGIYDPEPKGQIAKKEKEGLVELIHSEGDPKKKFVIQ